MPVAVSMIPRYVSSFRNPDLWTARFLLGVVNVLFLAALISFETTSEWIKVGVLYLTLLFLRVFDLPERDALILSFLLVLVGLLLSPSILVWSYRRGKLPLLMNFCLSFALIVTVVFAHGIYCKMGYSHACWVLSKPVPKEVLIQECGTPLHVQGERYVYTDGLMKVGVVIDRDGIGRRDGVPALFID